MRKLLITVVALIAGPSVAVPAHSSTPASPPESASMAQAQLIRAEVDTRYKLVPGRRLAVTEATTTSVIESFTLLSADLQEARVISADNGIYYAICPRGATCPYPHRGFARPAADFLPRRLALELALRTFLETSVNVVVVSLPTSRFILFVVERAELGRYVDPDVARALSTEPSKAPTPCLRQLVERLTRPHVFVFLSLEPTPSGRSTLGAMPRWPVLSASDEVRTANQPGETGPRC